MAWSGTIQADCLQCKRTIAGVEIRLSMGGYYCTECAGFNTSTRRFETREDWIRETTPFEQGTPAEILADWLYEQSRQKDSDYMRQLAEKLKKSGG